MRLPPSTPTLPSSPQQSQPSMALRYAAVRAATEALARPLSAEDCCAQSMPDASPVKWHLAHTSWFFETFVLEAHESGFRAFDPAFRVLFNSYYHGVGRQHPRPQRGLITRPDLATVRAYRADVDARMQQLLSQPEVPGDVLALVELGLQHEQQHQELILTDVKHLLWCNPLWPAYQGTAAAVVAEAIAAQDTAWRRLEGGLAQIGHDGEGFAFDNETPRHTVFLQPFEIATRPVTNAQYLAFVQAGGYREPAHWLAEGWDWRRAQGLEHPIYWRGDGECGQGGGPGGWSEFTLTGERPLHAAQPVVHLSYYEADAFARWAGARLPTEAEWEVAAAAACAGPAGCVGHPADADVLDDGSRLHPRPAAPAGGGDTPPPMGGEVWEWTQSSYAPYPGFAPAPGAVGEYNGKFMVNQYVLRGGSCATPPGHVRASYRNFFPATARWQFTGLRLARDAR